MHAAASACGGAAPLERPVDARAAYAVIQHRACATTSTSQLMGRVQIASCGSGDSTRADQHHSCIQEGHGPSAELGLAAVPWTCQCYGVSQKSARPAPLIPALGRRRPGPGPAPAADLHRTRATSSMQRLAAAPPAAQLAAPAKDQPHRTACVSGSTMMHWPQKQRKKQLSNNVSRVR